MSRHRGGKLPVDVSSWGRSAVIPGVLLSFERWAFHSGNNGITIGPGIFPVFLVRNFGLGLRPGLRLKVLLAIYYFFLNWGFPKPIIGNFKPFVKALPVYFFKGGRTGPSSKYQPRTLSLRSGYTRQGLGNPELDKGGISRLVPLRTKRFRKASLRPSQLIPWAFFLFPGLAVVPKAWLLKGCPGGSFPGSLARG